MIKQGSFAVSHDENETQNAGKPEQQNDEAHVVQPKNEFKTPC